MHAERPLIANEAEHGVLGALMHEPEQCEEIGATLDPVHFSNEDNGALYAMILACHSKKVRPDSITLSEIRAELPSGELTIVYASEIMRNVPSAVNGKHYAKIVIERANARKLYEVGQQLMELAMSSGVLSEQVARAQALVMELDAQDDTPDVVTMKEALGDVFDDMQDRLDGKQVMGLDFGLSDLDKLISSARPGNLGIIAGRPGTGKTVLGLGLADRTAVNGGSSLVFSLEMPKKELAKRSLAAQSSVSQNWIESGQAVTDEAASARIFAATAKLSNADIRICDKGGMTFARICSIARFQNRAKKLDLIVIDYLSLIAPDPNARYQNRNIELGAYTRGFKALAKELGIPVVVLAQLNRGIESRGGDAKPKMSDLRDSGEIENDADWIIIAHRDKDSEHGRNGITEIEVPKVRHAQIGGCLLQFQGEYARFVNAAAGSYDDEPSEPAPPRRSARSMVGSGR
jgi:replicative DNA helicase